MRKKSIILYVTVILLSAEAAIASSKAHKQDRLLYYKDGNNYYYAGTYGVDYDCELDGTSICTYYYEPTSNQYLPYSTGKYVSFQKLKKK